MFVPYYFGSRRVSGVDLPEDRIVVLNRGGLVNRLKEVPFKIWGFSPHLSASARRVNPALIHAHYGPNGVRVLPLAKALAKPLLVTFHGSDANIQDHFANNLHYGHRKYIRQKHVLMREARLFIAVSEFIRSKLIAQGFPSDRVITHYIGIDTELFRADLAVKRESVVLFVGRLIENKGGKYLIRAMSEVQKEMPEVELVVIGDGPDRTELIAEAKTRLRRYRFLGTQSHHVVRQWMNRARVVAQPSVTLESGASEGLPMVLCEALAMGTPIVSSHTAGIPELVVDKESGLLVPERQWQALAANIAMLLKHDALWDMFSTAGRKRVQTAFNLQRQCEKLDAIYQDVVAEQSATAFQRV